MPNPALHSKPSRATILRYINVGHDDLFTEESGKVFGDGSCLHPSVRAFARSGFSVVQINNQGEILRAIYGSVPASLPQTSLSGEYAALSAAFDVCSGATFVTDCAEIVRAHSIGVDRALKEDTPHACTWRVLVARHEDLCNRVVRVVKTKAHRKKEDLADDPEELLNFLGNEAADRLAKEGAALHAPEESDLKLYAMAKQELTAIALHMTETLGDLVFLRQERFGRVSKLPAGLIIRSGNKRSPHNFVRCNRFWICSYCLLQTNSLSSGRHSKSVCNGETCVAQVLLNPQGHKLCVSMVQGGGFFLYCKLCYSYCSPHPRNLKRPCLLRPFAFGPAAKSYIERSMHPTSRLMLSHPRRV